MTEFKPKQDQRVILGDSLENMQPYSCDKYGYTSDWEERT